ncbi:DUF86 domain-containing protein [Methanotorris formicicus]|uniref:DUF86 domain-containing protein n=1 Tax=Methanotorris formicicus Mc-S-70 TaxID=647171 RepID=H1KWP4_9EURY|nr:DUF86 domain-containing protein [Methanotorris formicicus]EHP89159.1 protein of unknown function DUF86 [Methanotorris formicicus Mc-S-70]
MLWYDTETKELFQTLQVCVDVAMDVVAMLVKDVGLNVEDDYTNIEKLLNHNIITKEEATLLKQYNGLRNAIVHKYDKLNLEVVKEGLKRIDELYEIIIKLIEFYEKVEQ